MPVRAILLTSSVVLVVLAAVLLAGGLVSDEGIGWFFASIGSSVVAGVALVGATRTGEAPVVATVAARSGGDDWLRDDGGWHDRPSSPAPPELPAPPPAPPLEFPIADYDDLTTDEVLGLLPQLYSDELDVVEERERRGATRPAILDRLAELRETGTDADRTFE